MEVIHGFQQQGLFLLKEARQEGRHQLVLEEQRVAELVIQNNLAEMVVMVTEWFMEVEEEVVQGQLEMEGMEVEQLRAPAHQSEVETEEVLAETVL